MPDIEFKILLRKPKYPLIIISSDDLYPAFNMQELAQNCMISTMPENQTYITAIDTSGEEFWYSPQNYVITPGFLRKKWTKKQIVALYNENLNENQKEHQYSTKSLSAKRLDKIVTDICTLLKKR